MRLRHARCQSAFFLSPDLDAWSTAYPKCTIRANLWSWHATFWFRDMQTAINNGFKRRQITTQHPRLDINKKADRKATFLLRDWGSWIKSDDFKTINGWNPGVKSNVTVLWQRQLPWITPVFFVGCFWTSVVAIKAVLLLHMCVVHAGLLVPRVPYNRLLVPRKHYNHHEIPNLNKSSAVQLRW